MSGYGLVSYDDGETYRRIGAWRDMSFDIRLAGKREAVVAHLKDKLKGLKEQSEECHPALETSVLALLDHMPQKSQIHNGVMVHVSGHTSSEIGRITIVVESVQVAGG